MKKSVIIASLAVSLAMATTAQAATQFVTNGDFSSLTAGLGQLGYNTDATGWSSTGYNFVMNVGDVGSTGVFGKLKLWDLANGGTSTWNGQYPTGANFVAMDGDFENGPIAQTITGLTVGKSYTLSFDYAFAQQQSFTGDTIQNLVMNFGAAGVNTGSGDHPYTFAGGPTWTSADYTLPSEGFSGWQTYSTTLTATSTSEVLSFLALGNLPIPPFALLTGVSLTASVPEPATWGMMILGLGAMGVVARRRRRMLAVA